MQSPRAWCLASLTLALHAASGSLAASTIPPATIPAGQGCDLWTDKHEMTHARAAAEQGFSPELLAIGCLGYVHGKERFWQMDHYRRIAEGRLAELKGASAIRSDFFMRMLGLAARAKKLFAAMSPATKAYWEAYAQGVNLGLRESRPDVSYEYRLEGASPVPWEPQDSITVALLQSFDQTQRSFQHAFEEEQNLAAHGAGARELFSADGTPWDTAILKPGEFAPAEQASHENPAGALAAAPSAASSALATNAQGSNNWVLAPSRSKTGNAWLANDPHLGLKLPPFWHWVHIQGGKFDVIGGSVPGIPFVASGANRHVAWGLTTAYMNVSHILHAPEREVADQPSERPVIWFKWWKLRLPFFFKTFKRTKEGFPVLPVEASAGQVVVLRWTGFELAPEDFQAVFKLMTASSVGEADQALSEWGLPSWNFVFADDHGGIGYRTVGRSPKNLKPPPFGAYPSGDGPRPQLKPEEMPHLLNPARGYVVTANNRQWPKEALLNSGRAHRASFRAFRIEEELLARPSHDLESQRRIQCDVQAIDARFLLPRLLPFLKDPALDPAIVDLLARWDFATDTGCRACALYRQWINVLLERTRLDEVSLFKVLANAKEQSGLAREIVASFRHALTDLRITSIADVKPWGELHRAFFRHQGDDRWLPKTQGLPTPGDENTVNLGANDWNPSLRLFEHTDGPSQRLIVELSAPPRVFATLAGPNQDKRERDFSGPESAWAQWARCELERREFPLDWSKVQAKRVRF